MFSGDIEMEHWAKIGYVLQTQMTWLERLEHSVKAMKYDKDRSKLEKR